MDCQRLYSAIREKDLTAGLTLVALINQDPITVDDQIHLYKVGRQVCVDNGLDYDCLKNCLYNERKSQGLVKEYDIDTAQEKAHRPKGLTPVSEDELRKQASLSSFFDDLKGNLTGIKMFGMDVTKEVIAGVLVLLIFSWVKK